jgi:carbon-monoxide dehydrogenase small subunit
MIQECSTVKQLIKLTVNGNRYDMMVSPNETLADAVRRQLRLTGTKISCNQGDCGACTMLIDSKPLLSCLTLAVACEDKDIRTIEGLETNGKLDPIQRAILEKQGVQCGFCTPGIIMSARALLDENPNPTREEIKRGLSGNLCRCTGYAQIIEAVESVVVANSEQQQPAQLKQ